MRLFDPFPKLSNIKLKSARKRRWSSSPFAPSSRRTCLLKLWANWRRSCVTHLPSHPSRIRPTRYSSETRNEGPKVGTKVTFSSIDEPATSDETRNALPPFERRTHSPYPDNPNVRPELSTAPRSDWESRYCNRSVPVFRNRHHSRSSGDNDEIPGRIKGKIPRSSIQTRMVPDRFQS